MKRFMPTLLAAALFASVVPTAPAALIYWSGLLPTGWKGGVTPANGDNLYLGSTVNEDISLAGSINLGSVVLAPGGDTFTIDSSVATTLGLTSLSAGDTGFGRLVLKPNIAVSLSGPTSLDAGNNAIVVYNKISGTAAPVFLSTGGSGAFLFVNNIAGPNDYVGNTTVGNGTSFPTIAFWGGSPFGTGTVTFLNGGFLVSHNTDTIANNLVINSVGSSNALNFKNWDASLTVSGSVTLANNTTFQANQASTALAAPDGSGSYPQPGPIKRYPTIISGNIGESGGARTLTLSGPGIFLLTGTNTYSGGTTVNGNVIFGINTALPGTGSILVNSQGYAGIGDISSGNFAAQLAAHFNLASGGAVGVDSLPANSTVTFGDAINLTGFTNANIRIGTATSAILTGTITPQGTNYQFGNGGGSLYVQSALTGARGVTLNNTGSVPLKLYLQGTNTYTGNSTSSSGILIFDGASAIPTATANSLTASGSASSVASSYVGYTDITGVNGGSLIGSTPATFLSLFNKTNTYGVIGFDTHVGNPTATVTGAINLTGFNDGVYLGTATSAILSGTLTPSSVTNASNSANTLRFTAVNGGTLTVNSTLADNGSPLAAILGTPTGNNYFEDGTVVLNGTNSYTGGTTLYGSAGGGLTVVAGNAGAFGSGTIKVASGAAIGLQAGTAGLVLPNAIAFQGNTLDLTGTNDITLAGAITGAGTINLNNLSPINATLSHDNSGYSGNINVTNGLLNLPNNNAAGTGTLSFLSSNAGVYFNGAATAPVLHGISGDTGSLFLANGTGTVLTFQIDDDTNHESSFGGVISAPGGATTDATVVITANNNSTNGEIELYGHNRYTGGTTINGYGVLALGQSDSAGSGPVTISATAGQGGLILNTGITFTNPIVLNSGGLAGLGSFAPSSVTGTGQTAGKITFGTNQLVFPGIPGSDNTQIPGVLTIQMNVAFANGGNFREMIQDPTVANTLGGSTVANINGGYGLLSVQGDLSLTALTTGGFLITVSSVDSTNSNGFSSAIVWGQSYSIPIVQTTGSVLGFNAVNFSFDASSFQDGYIPNSAFSVSADTNHLYLNFTAVPEPSTWALLATGAGFLGLAALRRRRA